MPTDKEIRINVKVKFYITQDLKRDVSLGYAHWKEMKCLILM
jgi:hypothetical protein